MSAPPVKPDVATCQRKWRYADEHAARAMGSIMCEQWKLEFAGVYSCRLCRGWHVTTKRKERKLRVTKDEVMIERASTETSK